MLFSLAVIGFWSVVGLQSQTTTPDIPTVPCYGPDCLATKSSTEIITSIIEIFLIIISFHVMLHV